jgi:hypothetical protein
MSRTRTGGSIKLQFSNYLHRESGNFHTRRALKDALSALVGSQPTVNTYSFG